MMECTFKVRQAYERIVHCGLSGECNGSPSFLVLVEEDRLNVEIRLLTVEGVIAAKGELLFTEIERDKDGRRVTEFITNMRVGWNISYDNLLK